MERLSKFAVMPVRGEVAENILVFGNVYPGLNFGDVGNVKQYFGDRYRTAENPGVICIAYDTGDSTEVEIGFRMVLSNMGLLMSGDLALIQSDHPWAQLGDEGNVTEWVTKNGEIGVTGTGITFLSADGKDPREGTTKVGYVPREGGTGYVLGRVSVPPRPDGGLRPRTRMYVTLRRTDRTDGNLPPLNLMYVGSDDPENGGEVFIPAEGTPPPAPSVTPELDIGELDMVIMGTPGIWSPN